MRDVWRFTGDVQLSARQKDNLSRVMREMGMPAGSIDQLFSQEEAYQQWASDTEVKWEAERGITQDARRGTYTAIGGLMAELSNQAAGQQNATTTGYMRSLEADINRVYNQQTEDVARMAGVSGFNPGRAFSDLAQNKASALRDLPYRGSLQTGQILAMLQGSLAPAQATAGQAAGLRTGASVSASQVAGNQASVMNQIVANQNAQSAQAMGAGIAGAGSALSSGLLLASEQLRRGGPGTGGQSQFGPYSSGYQAPYVNPVLSQFGIYD
jgi:hypothetical protein